MTTEATTSAAKTSRRSAILLVALALVLGALLGVTTDVPLVPSVLGASVAADKAPAPDGGSRGGVKDAVTISGHVEGLFPGALTPLVLTVTNRKPFDIVLTSLAVTVDDAGATCPAANLTVAPFVGSMPIPGRGTRPVVVSVSMAPGAPGSCQTATWPLHYLAHVEKP